MNSEVGPGEAGAVAARARASVAVVDPHRSLRRDSVRFLRTVSLSVGIQGPTAGVIVGPAVLAGIVGGSGALAYLLALVAMSFVAYAFVLFSRSFNSASSVFAFNGSILGASYGFVSVWMLLLVYVSFAGGVYASTADIAGTLLQSLGVHVGWVVLAIVGWALTMVFAYVSISRSAIVILLCEGVAIALIAVVGVAVLTSNSSPSCVLRGPVPSSRDRSERPWARSRERLWWVLRLRGCGDARRRGDELTAHDPGRGGRLAAALRRRLHRFHLDRRQRVREPRRVGRRRRTDGPPGDRHDRSGDGQTRQRGRGDQRLRRSARLHQRCQSSAVCTGPRGRRWPSGRRNFLVRTSTRHGSPVGALLVTGSVSLAALLAFSFERSPIRALTFIVEYGAYLIVGVYLLTVIAALVLVWRRGRRPIPLLILGLGVGVLAYVLYDTFVPLPAGPFRVVALAAACSVVAGDGSRTDPRDASPARQIRAAARGELRAEHRCITAGAC